MFPPFVKKNKGVGPYLLIILRAARNHAVPFQGVGGHLVSNMAHWSYTLYACMTRNAT